ncbi:999_t:CDS:1, partial [Gigaspora margarita]
MFIRRIEKGFATVRLTRWERSDKDGTLCQSVAIKSFNGSKNNYKELLKE